MTEILIGRNDSASVSLDRHYGNPHGMIAGATGTGTSVSLMVLAEGFSRLGVACFLADAKGVAGVIRGQLGNRIQHALRAFTPRDQKAVEAAAETFVANPQLNVTEVITKLAVGEALASTLANGGVPTPVEQVLVTTPCCRIGAITDAERRTVRQRSPVGAKYDTTVNRESAAEMLTKRVEDKAADATKLAANAPANGGDRSAETGWGGAVHDAIFGTKRRQGMIETMGKQMVRTAGSQLGRQILRGVLGGIFGGKR